MADDYGDLFQSLMPGNASEAQAMLAALGQQQAQQRAERSKLAAALAGQQQEASGLRGAALLSSFGQNPLLANLRQTAEQQGQGLESLASRTEGQLAGLKSASVDPLRVIALKQAQQRLAQQEAEAAARAEREKTALGLREKALNNKLNAPPKAPKAPTLPAAEAASLGQADAALKALDALDSAYQKFGGGKTVVNAAGKLLGVVDTDAALYGDAKKATSQSVGTFLERGKLAAGDESKYDRLMPDITDSPARKAAKIANLKRLIMTEHDARQTAFNTAGYNVPAVKTPDIDLNAPAPAPAKSAPAVPEVPDAPRLRPGQKLMDALQEGQKVRINTGGGAYRVVVKRGGKILEVK